MKKRLLILVGFLLCTMYIHAQAKQSDPKLFVGAVAVDYKAPEGASENENINVHIQIGGAMSYQLLTASANDKIETVSFGFPYSVLYIAPTFIEDKFEVSKGYFTNEVKITWQIGNNQEFIQSFDVYRRELGNPSSVFEQIASLGKNVFEFNDSRVEGGVLFEYQIRANGVPTNDGGIGELVTNYMQGIGFRNPTATVSGSVTFEGGSPVQDVTVFAESLGAENRAATSLHFKDASTTASITDITNIKSDALTLQFWVNKKIDAIDSDSKLLEFTSTSETLGDTKYTFDASIVADSFFYGSLNKDDVPLVFLNMARYIPTGELDPAGDDVFALINELPENHFIHLTVILKKNEQVRFLVNGREIDEAYNNYVKAQTNDSVASFSVISDNNNVYNPDSDSKVSRIDFTGKNFKIDEFRAWNRVLTNEEVRRDYRRYLDGSEGGLATYLRMDEATGEFLYDLSKVGFNQNQNDAFIIGDYEFSTTRPTQKQLGVFGVTDKNGSYIISGIGYKGTGESFIITPSLGVHEFEPASQTLFLGTEEPVVNQLNFKDVSSFVFKGRAIYNAQNVFNNIPLSSIEAAYEDIEDYGYNQYQVTSNGSKIRINKGQFYYEGGTINPENNFYQGGLLKKYPVIPLEEAAVFIDGNPVFDEDNQPVLTDADGNFEVRVPIGNHKVEVKKDGHTFELNGRFPETDTFSFFENQTEIRYFIDDTRVSLVGRVVGGKNEFEKPIGFGIDGLFTVVSNEGDEDEKTETVSSVNNIGVAQIIFKGDINTDDQDKIVTTHPETGEYKVDLIPYQYTILSSVGSKKGITVASNTAINTEFLQENEVLDLREIPELQKSEFIADDDERYQSEPYQYVKSFRYNSPVKIDVLAQDYERTFTIGDETYDISESETRIYLEKVLYRIYLEAIQEYENKDGETSIKTKEFVTDGNFSITNALAAANSEQLQLDSNTYIYSFRTGEPNITFSDGFVQEIDITYETSNGITLIVDETPIFRKKGIIKGGKASDGKAFVTTAPESPDIILRDPPGTNSFASIERGTKITSRVTKSNNIATANSATLFASVGPDVSIGITTSPLTSIDLNVNVVAETEGTFSVATQNISEGVTEKTYTFNQTITTSDSPDFVGAEGDLYIGNAKNIFYGIFDNMFITKDRPVDKDGNFINSIKIGAIDSNGNRDSLHVSTNKAFYIAEQPTSTFFTYSQKFILETLIPELDTFATRATSGDTTLDHSAEYYRAQANLWRRVIQNNEQSKYNAKNNRAALKDEILDRITNDFSGNFQGDLRTLVNENFFSNRSFDAGLGEFNSAVTTTVLNTDSYETVIDLSGEFRAEIGQFVNGVGATLSSNNKVSGIDTDRDDDERERTTTINYTFKDNDQENTLSVDVVNVFDGNGPVFITRGGATSCPHEDSEISNFFVPTTANDNPNFIGVGGTVLSDATNNVYDVEISAKRNRISNVPESEPAVFTILLKNTSQTQSNLEFVLDFDPISLNGAEINLETNGVNVFLPFNETIEFPIEISKSSGSSRFTYDDIKIFIYSPCATSAEKNNNVVTLSAEFKKSCSNVAVSLPEDNWIFNNNQAYSTDSNGNQTTNTLPITFTDFNTDFNGFEKISLQYKNVNSSSWTRLQTYYGSETLKNDAGDEDGIVINSSDVDFTFNWDIVGNNIADGLYEIRAVSFCANNITNTSEIISGTINLNAPVVFGTPKPTDGILDVGEDISVRFNEDIFENTSTSITVTGLQNKQEVKHDISVFIDGSTNQIELPNQRLGRDSFTLQFWYKNGTIETGNLVSQENGINVKVDGNHLEFSVGGESITTLTDNVPIDDSQYNFYSFVYQNGASPQLLLFENGNILEEKTLAQELDINTSSSIFIGGQNVVGNIHDIRLWSKPFTPAQATVAKDVTLTGRELNLIGYWKLDEGFGTIGLDKAKRRNAIVNLDWTIFPKGTGYQFANNQYLTLDNVGFIQPSNFEDKTLSFWIKADATSSGTIFSNGKGDDSELILTNGFRNKWSINLKNDGNLELVTENVAYNLTSRSLPSNKWTHVAVVHKVGGSLNSYIDGEEQLSISASKIGGFTGNKILIGARLFEDFSNNETIDNHFTGLLDEIRFWNTARSLEQIKRDRYFEIDSNSEGLLLKLDFNEDSSNTTNGPAYNHLAVNLTRGTTFALLSQGAMQSYTQDSPPLKPALKFTNIPFSTVINGDEMIITPNLTDEEWSLFEGETLNFTVTRLADEHFNTQLSPVTWSAFVNRQEIEWFTKDQTKEIVAQKTVGDDFNFTMDVINIGGSNQPFTISGLPTWMQAEVTSGTINPDSSKEITFTVDADLAMGTYEADVFLETASGFNDRLSFNLRVLTEAPDWSVNPADYASSMNAIGRIQIDGIFSRDPFTKVGAFVNNKPRGEAYLTYDASYDSYFAFLTVYENQDNDAVTFKIWDAINGKIINASIDGKESETYENNKILGSKSSPVVFSSTTVSQQNLSLNKGWTWASFFVEDANFSNIKDVFEDATLENQDIIKHLDNQAFYEDGDWFGDFSTLTPTRMYKIRLANANNLQLFGNELDIANFDINIFGIDDTDPEPEPKWNWLPYPIHRNISIEEALSFYQPTDGDVIKDQFNFAIYDLSSGWSGTLNYLESGRGYMLKSSQTQVFNYPDANVLSKSKSAKTKAMAKVDNSQFTQYRSNMNIVAEVIADEFFTKVLIYDANNVLRGSSDIIDFNNKRISFITAFSSSTENLRFVLADDNNEVDIQKNFTFTSDAVLGDLKNPVQLSTKALSLSDINLDATILYPNPFTNSITIDFSRESVVISKVELYNTLGIKLISETLNTSRKTELATNNLAVGVYLIKITDDAGKYVIKKIIKK